MSARKFLVKLLEVEENLCVCVNLYTVSPLMFNDFQHHTDSIHLNSDKRPTLTLTTLTHDLSYPWISPRDIRLAAELERFYRDGAFGPTKGKLALQPPSHLVGESWAKLLKAYPWDNDGARIVDNMYYEGDS